MPGLFDEADVIHVYTRKQAIDDGVLVDLTEWGSADKGFLGGFQCPVAVTREVWTMIEAIPESLKGIADVRGRAHDVLFLASLTVRALQRAQREAALFRVILPAKGTRKRLQTLKVVLAHGDAGETTVTIMLPGQD